MPHQPKTFSKEFVTVGFMVEQIRTTVGLDMEAVNDVDAAKRIVTESNLHRPGLVLAGYVELFTYERVQVLGNTENQFLQHLPPPARSKAFQNLLQFHIPCIILTENNMLDESLIGMATEAGVPVYSTSCPSTKFMSVLRDFLNDQFAPQMTVHGSLIDVYGAGLLLIGKSGIGKSEVALDLVERGHRLVADDVVIVTKKEEQILMGSGTDLVQHFMEIRGLGLVDVRAMFGIRAIRFQKRVEVVVNMQIWDAEEEYTRIGMIDDIYEIMGVELPMVKLPITPGKNVTVICEVIAMNHLLRHYGYDPAEVFAERLAERIRKKGSPAPLRGIEYFEHDYE
ncbi:MAG TPA: HPr(Ser) kinase/phosphatase [Rhodothermales bacterium]|nr:HPr(Ser) kinase/phosphatase [Rhodothermales bacterium]